MRGPSWVRTLLNDDFREMLSVLNDEGVEYLVVGAYALAAHGVPRATGDIDVWLRSNDANAARAWRAMARSGAPMARVTTDDLTTPEMVVEVGGAPCRIDLLTSIDGVDFDDAWERRSLVRFDDIEVPVVSPADLIRNKRATGRPQDLADIAALGPDGESDD